MTKRAKIGIVLIAWPIVGLVAVLTLYAILSFVSASIIDATTDYGFLVQEAHAQALAAKEIVQENESGTLAQTAGSLVRIALDLLGILAVLGMFISVPVGIYFLATANKDEKQSKK